MVLLVCLKHVAPGVIGINTMRMKRRIRRLGKKRSQSAASIYTGHQSFLLCVIACLNDAVCVRINERGGLQRPAISATNKHIWGLFSGGKMEPPPLRIWRHFRNVVM